MTLDEAIEHCEQTARSCDGECSDDHRQLAEWLRELKRLREERDEMYVSELIAIIGRDTFKATSKRLRAENDKLRELTKSAWGCVNRHVSCDACRMTCGGCTLQSAMRELGIEVE